MLRPLPGRGLVVPEPARIDGSVAGLAFLRMRVVEQRLAGGVRLYLPLLDGCDEVGVLVLTLDAVDDDDRRLLARLADVVAGLVVTKNSYTDQFVWARRAAPLSLAAEIQWGLLPPLAMTTPQVAVAGILEPAYDVAGDSFDYAINDTIMDVAVIDAMGHGLNAAMLASLAIGAYRHARRARAGLAEMYRLMDAAISQFVTAQMMRLDIATGLLQWVNAGHLAALLIRGHRVVRALEGPATLPVGFGGAVAKVSQQMLRPGDRVLSFTDGVIEEHQPGGELFGEQRLREFAERAGPECADLQDMVRRLSHSLMQARGGRTTDDAALFLMEWRGAPAGTTQA